MLIDWFTVGAQVVNFLVLVVVLKLLLFDRVVTAMDQREQAIAERIRDAEDREADAQVEGERYRAQQAQLEADREDRLAQAEADAAARRKELIEQATASVDQLRHAWQQSLQRDRAHLLEEVRRRTGEQACTISRRALADLADVDLEARLVRVALRRLEGEQQLGRLLAGQDGEARTVTVRTHFSLAGDLGAQVVKAVAAQLGCDPSDVELLRDPALVCGLEIRQGAWSVGWSVDGYLDTVTAEMEALLPAWDLSTQDAAT